MFVDVPAGRDVVRPERGASPFQRRRGASRGSSSRRRVSSDGMPSSAHQRLQERAQAHLVPGLRRLRRAAGALPGAERDRPPAARDRLHLRHRLLEPHPRLHHRLRLQQRARPRAPHRAGSEAGQPGPPGGRGRRRRRRLLHRRRARAARHPPQRRPHLPRDGQPGVRAHQGPALAHVGPRPEDGHLAATAASSSPSTRCSRAGLRRGLRGAGDPGGHAGHDRAHRGGDPLPGLLLRQHPVALRHLRRGGAAAQGAQGADEVAGQPGARPGEPARGAGPRPGIRRPSCTPASSTGTRSPADLRRAGAPAPGGARRGASPGRGRGSSRRTSRS